MARRLKPLSTDLSNFVAVCVVASGLSVASTASAAIAPLRVRPGQVTPSILSGAIAGGQAADEFSILAVKRLQLKSGGEKLMITYGDRFGKPIKGEPGFFHVSLDRGSKRVVIDLAQVSRTAVDPDDLAKILSASKFVSGSDMTMDPQDGSTNITLSLRAPVAISVATESGVPGLLAIEMRDAHDFHDSAKGSSSK